jgi:hypothetical protein
MVIPVINFVINIGTLNQQGKVNAELEMTLIRHFLRTVF